MNTGRNRTPNRSETWGRATNVVQIGGADTGCERECETRREGKLQDGASRPQIPPLTLRPWDPCPPGNLGRCPDPSSPAPRAFCHTPWVLAQGLTVSDFKTFLVRIFIHSNKLVRTPRVILFIVTSIDIFHSRNNSYNLLIHLFRIILITHS